jgi:hypothetical protein
MQRSEKRLYLWAFPEILPRITEQASEAKRRTNCHHYCHQLFKATHHKKPSTPRFLPLPRSLAPAFVHLSPSVGILISGLGTAGESAAHSHRADHGVNAHQDASGWGGSGG